MARCTYSVHWAAESRRVAPVGCVHVEVQSLSGKHSRLSEPEGVVVGHGGKNRNATPHLNGRKRVLLAGRIVLQLWTIDCPLNQYREEPSYRDQWNGSVNNMHQYITVLLYGSCRKICYIHQYFSAR